ncbi:MAG: DNA internalization-related competence protein ComEC/Rec2 [Planctomycetaceae bacterium]
MASPAPQPFPKPREPALTAALLFAAGIVIDRFGQCEMLTWLVSGVVVAGAAVFGLRSGQLRWVAVMVALLLIAAGGARHHLFWAVRESSSIAAYPSDNQPVRLEAVVASPISLRNNNRPGVPTWMRVDHSVFLVEGQSLVGHDGLKQPATGLVRVDVSGHLLDTLPGDRILIRGQLSAPEPPGNPGDFDYPEFLRSRGIDRIVRCEHPDSIQLVERPRGLLTSGARLREAVRAECDSLIFEHLPPKLQPVAASLLIGDRSDLKEETETAFIRSGTMHILAISGLHIGVLAAFVLLMCRAVGMRSLTTWLLVLGLVYGYAAIAESRPPVMRAVVLCTLVVISKLLGRKSDGLQALGLSALVLLLINPADLFDVGAQLSFLAVAVIFVMSDWIAERTYVSYQDRLLAGERPLIVRAFTAAGRWLLGAYVLSTMIWIMTIPITMRTFHLVSPAGLVVNALLTPVSTLVLCAGYLFLGVGLLCPALAGWAVVPFRVSLSWFLGAVEWSSQLPGAAGESPVPSTLWMGGLYALLVAGVLVRSTGLKRWVWRGVFLWTLGWLAVAAWPHPRESGLTCTFLDVGHGEAIVVTCPNGRTLLYDIGSLGDGRRAARAVQALLRERGAGRIDALVLSHADADHYNGGIDLVAHTAIGTALFSQHCLNFEQEELPELFDDLASHGTRLKMIQTGDELVLDPEVRMTVLHPSPQTKDRQDNGNSVVLRIDYAGQSILLTGDLEEGGAASLMRLPISPIDLFLAPHHGGKSANTPELAKWAHPRHVFVSSGRDITPALAKIYSVADSIHCTAVEGAIHARIAPNGSIQIGSHRAGRPSTNLHPVATQLPP